jgi:SAM-dependent methyltransferase
MSATEYEYEGSDLLRLGEQLTNYNTSIADLIVKALPPRARILDFGAGFGTLTRIVAKAGVVPDCVEPDARQRASLERAGFRCYAGIEDVPDGAYECVYSSNVLEHIEDDVAALRQIRRALGPGGRIVVYLPAFQSLYTVIDAAIGHYRRYDARMITTRLQTADFRVESCYYADVLGFIVSWVFKRISNKVDTVNVRTMQIYDRVIFPLSRAIERVVRPPFGKNVVAIAVRND